MNTAKLNRHQQRRLHTRRQLMQAALELLLQKGYDAISVQDITDHANLGRVTFYIHFKDKEDIVWTLIREGLDEADRQAHAAAEKELPPQPEYFAYQNIFRHAAANRDFYRAILGSQGSAALIVRMTDYLVADFTREINTYPIYGRSADVPAHIVAQIAMGAILRLASWWLETPNDYSPEQMAQMLYRVLHRVELPRS